MAEREPTLLRDQADGSAEARPDDANTEPTEATPVLASEPVVPAPPARASGSRAPVVHVVGFWRRAVAAIVDLGIVIPTAMLITFLASKLSGVKLPSEKLRFLDLDLWIDLVLATDPAIVMGIVLFLAVGLTYLFVFHLLQGRTLGMRLLKMRVIDVYGDRPSPARCAARCAGYLASAATLFLGFLWMAFDSEKRGLQDWLAGTYVIRA